MLCCNQCRINVSCVRDKIVFGPTELTNGASFFGHNSTADCVRELFQPSQDVESLVVFIKRKLASFGFERFLGDVKIGATLGFYE